MATEIKLPKLGEGINSGIVAAVITQPGDKISAEDAIIELETDKAVIPISAEVSGAVVKITVSEGNEVKPGDLLAIVETEQSQKTDDFIQESTPSPAESIEINKNDEKKTISTDAPPQSVSEAVISNSPTPPISNNSNNSNTNSIADVVISPENIPAGPATRKLSRELGVNLTEITGTARGGRITLEDVKIFVKNKISTGGTSVGLGLKPLPDLSTYGEMQREKASKLRSIISERMATNWTNIPHVHQFGEIDITEIITLQKKYAGQFKENGSALSVTQFLIKGLAMALKAFPTFNASFDHIQNEIVYKKYFHIGVAVDTPSGLIVPVLRDVDTKSIFEVGKELRELAERTRERRVDPKELQGACITLSNLGGIGGTHFTPIINHPEVAILGAGRSSIKPVYIDGEFVPRTILPLCLAYDHRVIDGADGARFMVFLTDYLEKVEYHLMQ